MIDYQKAFEQEAMQFLFLCDEKDVKTIVYKYKKKNLGEYVRLAAIALTFGYRKMLMKIMAQVEKNFDDFLKGLDVLNNNFALLESWVNDFIARIKNKDAQNLVIECWRERKAQLSTDDFSVKKLL